MRKRIICFFRDHNMNFSVREGIIPRVTRESIGHYTIHNNGHEIEWTCKCSRCGKTYSKTQIL